MLVNVARFVRAVEHPHKLFSWFKVSIGRLTQVMRLGCILLLASLFTTSHAEDSASVTAIGNDIQRQWELGFAPGSILFIFMLLAVGLIWWTWRHYKPAPSGWWGTSAKLCRCGAWLLLIAVLTGPQQRESQEHQLNGTLAVYLDPSASMDLTDGPNEQARRAAWQPLRQALTTWADTHNARLVERSLIGGLDDAPRTTSQIDQWLRQRLMADQPDAAVLLSDGRMAGGRSSALSSVVETTQSTVERGAQRQLAELGRELGDKQLPPQGLWTLSVGADTIIPQLDIVDVRLPQEIPLGEQQQVSVQLNHRALESANNILLSVYHLPNNDQGANNTSDILLHQVQIPIDPEQGDTQQQHYERLNILLTEAGRHQLRFVAEAGDLSTSVLTQVSVSERTMKVLLLSRLPRYELRYLRAAWLRDQHIEVHAYLGEGQWRAWTGGSTEQPRLPTLSSNELRHYDAIIIGDLDGNTLSLNQQERIEQVVREEAVGLIWLPGESGNLASWRDTPLAQLIPVPIQPATVTHESYTDDIERRVQLSDAAIERALFTDLRPERLASLRGAYPISNDEGLMAGSQVLWHDEEMRPLLVYRPFGTGSVAFMAVDDTWRWRRQAGDTYLHRSWTVLLNLVSSGRSVGRNPWQLQADPVRALSGEVIELSASPRPGREDIAAIDELHLELVPTHDNSTPINATDGVSAKDLAAHSTNNDTSTTNSTHTSPLKLTLTSEPGSKAVHGRLIAPAPGRYRLIPIAPLSEADCDSIDLVVLPAEQELLDPRVDTAAMASLAERSGGQHWWLNDTPDAIQQLSDALPDLGSTRLSSRVITWWDHWLPWSIIVTLLSIEWAIRRWRRLP